MVRETTNAGARDKVCYSTQCLGEFTTSEIPEPGDLRQSGWNIIASLQLSWSPKPEIMALDKCCSGNRLRASTWLELNREKKQVGDKQAKREGPGNPKPNPNYLVRQLH